MAVAVGRGVERLVDVARRERVDGDAPVELAVVCPGRHGVEARVALVVPRHPCRVSPATRGSAVRSQPARTKHRDERGDRAEERDGGAYNGYNLTTPVRRHGEPMVERPCAAGGNPRSRSIMPVFNERERLERAIDAVLGADVADDFELLIVDDGSTDGTRDILGGRDWPDARARASTTSATAARAPRSARRSPRRAATTRRSWTPTSSTSPRTSRRCSRPLRAGDADGRLRHARLPVPLRVQLLVRAREPGGDLRGERDLQQLGLRHHDRAEGDARPSCSARSSCASAASRSRPRSRRGCCAAGFASTRCRSATRARSREEGKKLTALDGLRVLVTLLRCRVA